MADSITIAGIGVPLVPPFEQGDSDWRGDAPRAFDNSLQDGRDSEKRNWSGESDWVTLAEYDALRAAVASGPVVCSGVVLGETVLASVEIRRAPRGPDVQSGRPDWTDINIAMSITLREA